MRKKDALQLEYGDYIAIHPPRQMMRRASDVSIGRVVTVTGRGGILVDVLHQEHWTGKVVSRQWVPYHHGALYAVEQG
jgi:hypothetical protein